MKPTPLLLTLGAACAFASVTASAAVLVQYNFNDTGALLAPSGTLANVTATSISLATVTAITPTGNTTNSSNTANGSITAGFTTGTISTGTASTTNMLTMEVANFADGSANQPNTNKYFQFSISANSGYQFDSLTSLTFDLSKNSTSTTADRGVRIRYSNDGFATSNTILATANNRNGAHNALNYSLDLSGLSSITGTLTFRFEPFAGDSTAAAAGIRMDNITVNGAVSAIPEPSAFAALAGLGALGLAASRRRRR